MFDRLAEIEQKYMDLADQVNDPDIIANQSQWRKLMKEYSDMTPIVEAYREYEKVKASIAEELELLEDKLDDDFRELVKEELAENKERLEELQKEITILLIPKDPNDEKNVIVEIRGGAGGDEAALFAADLFRMYTRYAERRKWKIEVMNASESDLGGYKEISFMITGQGAEIRKRRTPCAAYPCHRKRRQNPYIHRYRSSIARSGRSGRAYRYERCPCGCIPCIW